MEIQKKLDATVLIKWDGTKIIVPLPYDVVDKAIKSSESMEVWKNHSLRCKSINEWYEYNAVDDMEIYVLQNYKNHYSEIMSIIADRRKSNLSVSKEVINRIAEDRFNK